MKTFLSYFEKFAFRYFNFWDRASRGEYWCVMPVIWGLIIFAFLGDLREIWGFLSLRQVPPLTPLYYESIMLFALTFIPRLSLTMRRLHDSGRSGKWAFLPFVATKSSIYLVLGMSTAMVTSNMSGLSGGGFAGFGVVSCCFPDNLTPSGRRCLA
jgi:uncharacterized membrane protein YhaH (DUF805 family)